MRTPANSTTRSMHPNLAPSRLLTDAPSSRPSVGQEEVADRTRVRFWADFQIFRPRHPSPAGRTQRAPARPRSCLGLTINAPRARGESARELRFDGAPSTSSELALALRRPCHRHVAISLRVKDLQMSNRAGSTQRLATCRPGRIAPARFIAALGIGYGCPASSSTSSLPLAAPTAGFWQAVLETPARRHR